MVHPMQSKRNGKETNRMPLDKDNQATCTCCGDVFEPDPTPDALAQLGLCPDCEDTLARGPDDDRDFSAAE